VFELGRYAGDEIVKSLDTLVEKALTRRSFLAAASAVAATTAVAGCSDDGTITPKTSQQADADILNFALNLEYLEAEFYLRAATGAGLATADTTPGSASPYQTVGAVTAGSAAAVPGLSATQQALVNEIAYEEQEHVRFLRTALGTSAAPRPAIDLSYFANLGYTAGVSVTITGAGAFNPFASFDYFLLGGFIFEDVGVTAYAGAAPLISAAGVASGYLTAAAGILAVEAYHAGFLRTTLTARAIAAGTASAYPYLGYANQIAALRASLTVGNTAAPSQSGSVETLLTLPASVSSPSAIVPCDTVTAVGFQRTINQVLHIVYGSPTIGAKSGGFFPNGINSTFATTTA
jgi:hypothetical protein